MDTFYSKGQKIGAMPPPARDIARQSVHASIDDQEKSAIEKLKSKAVLAKKKYDDLESEIAGQQQTGISNFAHMVSYRRGLVSVAAAYLMMFGEYFLIHMTLAPLEMGPESHVIAAVLLISLTIAFDYYLSYIKRMFPKAYNIFTLIIIFCALLALLTVVIALAQVRGDLFQTLRIVADGLPEGQLASIASFQSKSRNIFTLAMIAATTGLCFVCSICLHEGMERIRRYKESPPFLRKQQDRIAQSIGDIASGISAFESKAKEHHADFEIGFASAEASAGRERTFSLKNVLPSVLPSVFSPVTLILVIILVLLFAALAHPADYFVLLDRSKSSFYKGFDAKSEFEKNKEGVRQIIQRLGPGDTIAIAGITCSSFSRPEIYLKGSIPLKEGYFKEKTLQERVRLTKVWEKQKIEADEKCTDIFGALKLASLLMPESRQKKLIIFSDMRHNANGIDIESPAFIKNQIIDEVQKKGLIPDLKGLEVYILGVHSFGKESKYYQSLKDFWQEYFRRSGAAVRAYSMEREVPK